MRGVWWVDFRYERKRIRRKSPTNTRRGALEFERQLRERLVSGMSLDGSGPQQESGKEVPRCAAFFAEWVETYAKTNNKPSEAYMKEMMVRRHLTPFVGKLRLDQVGVREIERYKAKKTRTLKPKTINNHLTVLRRSLVSAVEWGYLDHVPPVKWMRTAPPAFDFFTHEESERLLAATPEEFVAMVTTALRAGLRRGELMALRWQDVDFRTGKILVRRSVWKGHVTAPKNHRHREVPMSPQLTAALKEHRHLRGELVFGQPAGAMRTKDMIKRVLPHACRKAKLREIQWHVLRHSFASQGHGGRAAQGGPGATRARDHRDDDAVRAPRAEHAYRRCGQARCDEFWALYGHWKSPSWVTNRNSKAKVGGGAGSRTSWPTKRIARACGFSRSFRFGWVGSNRS
jgi:integrase